MSPSAGGRRRSITLLPLVGALYFMVSGGPFGLEELLQKNGSNTAILILLVTPILWSMPTALMVGELAAALPAEGGYYAWVRRAMGPFWGFQEAWLSLAASIFDMAIYPTLFVLYLGRLWPAVLTSPVPVMLAISVVGVCALWNLNGAKSVGGGATLMTLLLLAPFVVLAGLLVFGPAVGVAHPAPPRMEGSGDFAGGVLIAMWNYMGWDNASTIAGEVKRPQRTYPLAVVVAVLLVSVTYVVPVLALSRAGVDTSTWTTGAWVDVARQAGGPVLATTIVVGGMVSAFGMFNALCLSYSRLPVVLAEDGLLPSVFARRLQKSDAPWVAILTCSAMWTASLGLSFERLVSIDIVLYGSSLLLEFCALVVLRVREPNLARPFKIPGGVPVLLLLAAGPIGLSVMALFRNAHEKVGSLNAIAFAAMVIAAGPFLYLAATRWKRRRSGARHARIEDFVEGALQTAERVSGITRAAPSVQHEVN